MNIHDDPAMIRGRAAAAEVKARGGSAMEAALKQIEVTFNEEARKERMAWLAARRVAARTVREVWGEYLP